METKRKSRFNIQEPLPTSSMKHKSYMRLSDLGTPSHSGSTAFKLHPHDSNKKPLLSQFNPFPNRSARFGSQDSTPNPLVSVQSKQPRKRFGSQTAVKFFSARKEDLIQIKQDEIAQSERLKEQIRNCKTIYRIHSKPARYLDSIESSNLIPKPPEKKKSEAQLFKITKEVDPFGKYPKPSFLDVFYHKNGIETEYTKKMDFEFLSRKPESLEEKSRCS